MVEDNKTIPNTTPSIEIKTTKINKSTVDKMNKTRTEHGAETIAVISTEGFTKSAREMLEAQGVACITTTADIVKDTIKKMDAAKDEATKES